MAGLASRSSLLWALVLVPLLAFLGARVKILALGYYNAPGRMPLHSNFTSYEIKFQDEIRACEDAILLKDKPVVLLACDPGRETWNTVMGDMPEDGEIEPNAGLYVYDHGKPGKQALTQLKTVGFNGELRTIGFEFHESSSTLFVTNHLHNSGPRIEQFRVDFHALTATHLRSIVHPLINTPNSIVAYSENEFFVTNQHYFMPVDSKLLSTLETYLAPPLARVVHVRILPSGDIDAAVSIRQAFPNGITFFGKDNSKVAIASSNTAIVYIYNVTKPATANAHPTLTLDNTISNLPFLPDNLATSTDGALLIAGHPNLPKFEEFLKSRKICNRPEVLAKASVEERESCNTDEGASWVSEWTEEGGLTHIYSGWVYPTSTTAVRDRKRGFGVIAGLYAKGILVWKD